MSLNISGMQSLLETPLMAALTGLAVFSPFARMVLGSYFPLFGVGKGGTPLTVLLSLLTSGFLETNILIGALMVYIFLVFGRPLEREVGVVGLFLPMLWTVLGVSLFIVLLLVLLHLLGLDSLLPLGAAAYGMWPVAEVILLMQCRTSEPLSWTMPYVPVVKTMHLPLALVGFGVFSDIITLAFIQHRIACNTVAAFASFWLAWYYMRFVTADSSPSFAFHMFFYPAPVRAWVQKIGNATHRQASKAKLVRTGGAANASLLPTPAGMTASAPAPTLLPGSTEEDASRRRNIALAALAKRLQQVGDDAPAKEEETHAA